MVSTKNCENNENYDVQIKIFQHFGNLRLFETEKVFETSKVSASALFYIELTTLLN